MGIKEKFAKWKRKQEVKGAQQREVKKAEGTAYQKEKLKQAEIFGAQKAKLEREQKYKQLRTRGRSGGGIIGGMAEKINIAAENLGYAPQRAMKSVSKKRKGSKIIKVKGRSYKLVSTKKRKKKRRRAPQQAGRQERRFNPFSTSL